MKTVMLSRFKIARVVMLAGLVLAGSLSVLATDAFSPTASAAMTATQCYKYNGTNIPAAEPSDTAKQQKLECIDLGYCKTTAGQANVECSDAVYKASDQYKAAQEAANNDEILNSQISPILIVVCGTPASASQSTFDQAYADCYNALKAKYQECQDLASKYGGSDYAGSLTSCMQTWVKATYPDKKISANKLSDAIKQGIDAGTQKTADVNAEKADQAKAICEAKNLTYLPSSQGADANGCVDTHKLCTGGSLGWILCPVAEMLQTLIQWAAGIINQLMVINPIAGNASLSDVWKIFVGIANLLLVIAFLIVIFSQATSIGLSAYGIKKMLPRIIAAAILINLSYFICTIALDITNIIGGSIQGIVNAIPINLSDSQSSGSSWAADIASLALLGAGAYMAIAGYVAFMVPVLITGALSVISIFLIIALRQVVVILLIIVAPLAFAAMILPNTESLFVKWRKLLVKMLVMYPIVMFLLYGSQLVARLIQVTGTDNDTTTMLSKMVAFVIMTIGPFAGMYMYLKNSDKLMSMATGAVTKLGSGLQNWGNEFGKQGQKDISNRQTAWMQRPEHSNPFATGLARVGRTIDPRMGQVRRDAMSSQYDEAAKLASARVANDYVRNRYGKESVQGARAQATLDEIDMKEAKIKLDYQHKGDAAQAFDAALKTNDTALMKLSAGKYTDTAQLGALQDKMMADARVDDEKVATVVSYLNENHFAKVKEQDLGMMYAMNDQTEALTDAKNAKTYLKKLTDGGSKYDIKAMGASDAAIGGQEKYVLDRQTGWDDTTKTHSKPVILDQTRTEQILADPNLKSQIKQGQRDILSAGTAPTSAFHKPHP